VPLPKLARIVSHVKVHLDSPFRIILLHSLPRMTKFSIAISALLLPCIAASTSKESAFTLARVHYDDVLNENFSLLDALEDSSGMISMTNLPNSFGEIKKEVMGSLHSCLLDQQGGSVVAEESFADGTVRRSFATATTVEEGLLRLELDEGYTASAACRSFQTNLEVFRSTAHEATQRFSIALSREMEPHLAKPLLAKKADANSSYDTIEDLVAHGEQLEHFHSYQKTKSVGEEYDDYDDIKNMATIDLHTDQGFFIAFTPGMMLSQNRESDNVRASGGFYVIEEDSNDIPIQIDFDIETDDLVFMLGDGVNQYINNRVMDGENGRRHLRATPHAVSLKVHDVSQARVWYGRMVLPPKDAVVATTGSQTTLTYGDIRRRLGETPDAYIPAGLGCSSPTMRALQHSNTPGESNACEKGSLFCWARCMTLADYEISEEICAEQNLELKCINPRGQFTTGERHGDFFPACTDSSVAVTSFPEIPQKDEGTCTSETWKAFVDGPDDVEYDHSFDLTTEKNTGTILQWSVVDEEKGIVKGRLLFNNVFGWLGFGFANPDGNHNGMNGGNVLLALPGGNYSAKHGLEVPGMTMPGSDEINVDIFKKRSAGISTQTNPKGSTVFEYQISPDASAFRHWSEPKNTQDSMNVMVDECATSMTFETDNINGKKFNMAGMDSMIWAGNSMDYYVGYHGHGNRARFNINWKTGEGEFWMKEPVEVPTSEDSEHSHDHQHDDPDESGGCRLSSCLSVFAAAVAWFFF